MPVLIMLSTLPLSLVVGLWLLYFLGYNLSVAVGVGVIALAGVAVEIGVIMIVYLDQAFERKTDEAATKGTPVSMADLKSAVIDGAFLLVRPLMMTVPVLLACLVTLMLGTGTCPDFISRMAATLVDGMINATLSPPHT